MTNNDYTVISSMIFNNSVFVNLSLNNGKFIIIGSQYSAPSSNIDFDCNEWSACFPDFDSVLLRGDFNVHLCAMGYARENERSSSFLEHLISNSLFIMNNPDSCHTWVGESRKGRPDLTLEGAEICGNLSS